MPTNIVVPEVGESIVDARVARWLKKAGDQVVAGEPLVELETDKVDVEVAAPSNGILATIAHGDGADVKIGEVLGTIEVGTTGTTGTTKPPVNRPAPKTPAAPAPKAAAASAKAAAPTTPKPAPAPQKAVSATPSARRLARERDIAIGGIATDGPRVTKADVERAAKSPQPIPESAPVSGDGRPETRQRMSKRRATIARRLVEAQHTAALLTTFNEVDMTAVMALRERHKEAFKARHGIGLGIASFFIKASIAALQEFPRLNAEIQGDELVLKNYYDIGVAVGATEGLVVPVLRDADRASFADIEGRIRDFAARAGNGTLTLEDLKGGTFSITNGGVYGSLMSTPIVNPPQVAILGLHAIKQRPIGLEGQVVLRPMMYIALTYDHRIVDGSEAVRFLVRVKDLVEDPAALSIEM